MFRNGAIGALSKLEQRKGWQRVGLQCKGGEGGGAQRRARHSGNGFERRCKQQLSGVLVSAYCCNHLAMLLE